MDRFQDLPVIKVPPLQADEPTQLNAIQTALWPYLSTIEMFWWCLWWGILLYLVVKYLGLPLVQGRKR